MHFLGPILANNVKTDTNANITTDQKSKCSYDGNSTEFSSELEEVYEQFSKWLDDPIIKDNIKTLDPRDEAVLKFASSLLKRTLSESFVGVPLTEGCITSTCKYKDKLKVFFFTALPIINELNQFRYSCRREFTAKLSK